MAAWSAARRALADQRGLGLVEVVVASVIVGIAGVGVALMFSSGQAYISAEGDNRVMLFLAQQRVEQIRALGYASLFASPPSSSTVAVPNHPGYTRSVSIECVPRDNYAAASEACVNGTSALRIVVTVSVTPADAKSPSLVLRSILAPR